MRKISGSSMSSFSAVEYSQPRKPPLFTMWSGQRPAQAWSAELPKKVYNPFQNSDLGREEVDELQSRVQAQNTKRTTPWGLNKFEKWRDKCKIDVDQANLPSILKNLKGNSTLKLRQRNENR